MTQTDETIYPDSYITLNYRVSVTDGQEIISTFDMNPATLQMGAGQLSANLENCLIGLHVGDERHFELSAHDAFGAHNPELVQRIQKTDLPDDVKLKLKVNEPIHLTSETGIPYAGILKAMDNESVTVDFNHPLAGQTIFFDVQIIGVM